MLNSTEKVVQALRRQAHRLEAGVGLVDSRRDPWKDPRLGTLGALLFDLGVTREGLLAGDWAGWSLFGPLLAGRYGLDRETAIAIYDAGIDQTSPVGDAEHLIARCVDVLASR